MILNSVESKILDEIEKFNRMYNNTYMIKNPRVYFVNESHYNDDEYFECCVCKKEVKTKTDIEILNDDEFETFSDFEKHIRNIIRKEKLQKLDR